jgi:hypothetical protein
MTSTWELPVYMKGWKVIESKKEAMELVILTFLHPF